MDVFSVSKQSICWETHTLYWCLLLQCISVIHHQFALAPGGKYWKHYEFLGRKVLFQGKRLKWPYLMGMYLMLAFCQEM